MTNKQKKIVAAAAATAAALGTIIVGRFLTLPPPQMALTWRVASYTNGVVCFDERGQSNGFIQLKWVRENVLVLDVVNATNDVWLECSEDLKAWRPYPADYFQVTILKTNPMPVYVPLDRPMYFRGKQTHDPQIMP